MLKRRGTIHFTGARAYGNFRNFAIVRLRLFFESAARRMYVELLLWPAKYSNIFDIPVEHFFCFFCS